MQITVPTLVYRNPNHTHTVSVLFRSHYSVTHRSLSDALAKLARDLRADVRELAIQGEHDKLWPLVWQPEVQLQRLKLEWEVKKQFLQLIMPIVTFQHSGRRIAFCPLLDGLWFDVQRGEDARARTIEVLTKRIREDTTDGPPAWVSFFKANRRYWLSSIDMSVSMAVPRKKAETKSDLSELFGARQNVSGAQELSRVGRCLEEMFPDRLDRAFRRQTVVDQLEAWQPSGSRRPLLIVGDPLVGKTAIIHEWVYQRSKTRKGVFGGKNQTYLISPQRLISGMSYVGQWEQRWNAILKTAFRKQHTLYFDDLLGLFTAGKSSSSNLSAAHVLKGYVERREVFLLAEMTPSALRVFREQDRGFADMCEVLQVDEPSLDETLRILISLLGDMESKHHCSYEHDALPAFLELARHFSTRGVLPGTAATAMQHLASARERQPIQRQHVLELYSQRTGLQRHLVDSSTKLEKSKIESFFNERLIGQPLAVDAMTDVVSIAKAQLGDRNRPLGTLLFAGPTGVGKTEAAKTLATYLFGHVDQMVRFDMNEFVMPGSGQRLIGTFSQPDGLLTTAVRKQPFNVLLLDEIEKAHPEVFDLLLQVLGEGRLTDARGRTVDFTKSIIIMTSNVGADKNSHAIGFNDDEQTASDRFLGAIRDFWRPEFFNRIDRVVPFRQLDRDNLAQIAELLMVKLLNREGFRRHKFTVMGNQDVLDWVVDQGHAERLGARALRRAVERELVAPMSQHVSSMPIDQVSILKMSRSEEGLDATVIPLPQTSFPGLPDAKDLAPDFWESAKNYLNKSLEQCDALKKVELDDSHPLRYARYELVEYLQFCKSLLSAIQRGAIDESPPERISQIGRRPSAKRTINLRRTSSPSHSPDRLYHKELHAFQDIQQFVDDEQATANTVTNIASTAAAMLSELALMPLIVPTDRWNWQRGIVFLRSLNRKGDSIARRQAIYLSTTSDSNLRELGIEASVDINWTRLRIELIAEESDRVQSFHGTEFPDDCRVPDGTLEDRLSCLLVEGHDAIHWFQPLVGTFVWMRDGVHVPIQLIVEPLGEDESVADVIQRVRKAHEEHANDEMNSEQDPFRLRAAFDMTEWSSLPRFLAKRIGLPKELRTQY